MLKFFSKKFTYYNVYIVFINIPYYLLIITTVYYMLVCLDPDFSLIRTADAAAPDADGTGNQNTNTFSTSSDNIHDCEHRSRDRISMADCAEYEDNPTKCNFCDNNALDGTEGQSAIICNRCGCAICEDCNAPNSDSDKDSGIGEE